MDPAMFGPRGAAGKPHPLEAVALDTCRRCLVVDQCGAYAAANDLTGVWGGVYRPQNKGGTGAAVA